MSIERLDSPARFAAFAAWTAPGLTSGLIALDLLERTIVCCIFGSFAWEMAGRFVWSGDISTLLIVLAEALPFLFIVLRRPTVQISRRPMDWTVAVAASVTPLLVRPDLDPVVPSFAANAAFLIMLAGFSLQVGAKIVLGTRFGIVAANRGVCTLGPYRFVRHPMYAGYTVTHIGFLIAMPNAVNAALYALALILQIVRIHREEHILMQDPGYRAFAQCVRWRLLPGVY